MAPKKKEYPVDLRQIVIKHYLNADSEREIARKLIIPRTSVHYIIDKYKKKQNAFEILSGGHFFDHQTVLNTNYDQKMIVVITKHFKIQMIT